MIVNYGAIRKFPALFPLFCIILGIIFGSYINVEPVFLLVTVITLAIFLLIFYIFSKRLIYILDITLIILLVFVSMTAFALRARLPSEAGYELGYADHYGILLDNPEKVGKNTVFDIRLINSNGRFSPLTARVYAEGLNKKIKYGDVIKLRSKLRIPDKARNPSGFNFYNYLRINGINLISYCKDEGVAPIGHLRGNLFYSKIVFPFRDYCMRVFNKNLDDVHSALLQGLILGYRGSIPVAVKNMFSNAGIVHILAVSGLHIGIISFFLFLLFRTIRLPFNISVILSCIFLIVYAFVTGLRPSVVRATIMFSFIMLGLISQRRIILVNIIAISAIIVLLINPENLYDVGFQLSYAATFAIVILYERIYSIFPLSMRKIRVLRNFVLLPFSVSLTAQLGTAPIVAFYFFKVPLIATVSNIIIVPLVTLLIPAGLLTILGNLIHPFIATVLSGTDWLLLHLILKLSTVLAGLPHILLWVGRPSAIFFILYFPLTALFFIFYGRKRVKFVIYLVLFLLNTVIFLRIWRMYHPLLTVYFLDVSEGDASVIEFPDNKICIVDGGRRSDYVDYGKKVLMPFLHSKGIVKINTVIATHPDVDHYGGLITVLENFKVDKLFINGSSKTTFLYRKLLKTAKDKGIPIYVVHTGETIWCGYYPFYILNPPILKGMDLSSNEGSIVFKFGYGEETFLFTGDFSNRILKLSSDLLSSTVLKFPHHGARFGDEREFLSSVHPELTTISVGRNNRYGHPAEENIAILDSLKSRIYRTNRDGAIIFKTDGERIWTRTMVK